ncbi:MAG TPA: methyltransferase domain-containing protein [Candidatus Binataceae bacterium]|nr:methyltransferase domain-containing protein [Candidatus Binataceae bacterium]
MKSLSGIGVADVVSVYSSAPGDLYSLVFGQQVHMGGMKASIDLADRAGIAAGMKGVDLCCCNGADMRFLVRFRGVASMVGVDVTEKIVERGRRLTEEEGLSDKVRFVLADACQSGLPSASADFIWSEDAWCYVPDKAKLIAEAARIVRPGGVIAFTDWVEGPAGLSDSEAQLFLGLMTFANVEDIPGYAKLLSGCGCEVRAAEDTGRFPRYAELYIDMVEMQLMYDALRPVGFRTDLLETFLKGFRLLAELARNGKIAQARFIARRK